MKRLILLFLTMVTISYTFSELSKARRARSGAAVDEILPSVSVEPFSEVVIDVCVGAGSEVEAEIDSLAAY